MWLFPELMHLLRPVILERARPGTRVLTSTWDLGTWQPDKVESAEPPIYMWIVPARVTGGWQWDSRWPANGFAMRRRWSSGSRCRGGRRAGDRREVLEGATCSG